MKAKDTVVHADGCTTNLGVIGATCNCGAEAQAEISYKAGIRKVVKWMKEHQEWDSPAADGFRRFRVFDRDWQAKLKEWEVD